MKNKNKGKVEYVEQFRKITAIEKLPTLKQGFGDLFFQSKAENNKFIRLKDQPFLNQMQLNYRTADLCQNDYVAQYVFDDEQSVKDQIQNCMQVLNAEIQDYKDWAKELTDYVEKAVYSYVFKGQRASPPVALTDEMKNFDPITLEINNETKNKNKTQRNRLTEESVNMPKNLKRFDFNEITDYFMNDDFKQEDLDGNIDLAKKQFQVFRQFKNIRKINQIEQLKADYQKFQYHAIEIVETNQRKSRMSDSDNLSGLGFKNINLSHSGDQQALNIPIDKRAFALPDLMKPTRNLQQKFKYLSLHQSQLEMNINYFRNLGPPSRNIEDFIKNIALNDDQTENILEEDQENPFMREKIETCLLHFLQPKELKVDKSALDFYDVENIAMGRVTSTNSHMVIRSEKVTRLQYEKLLKKMEKLYKMQHEDGKTRIHIAISTDQVDEDPTNNRLRNQNNQNRLSLQKIVEQINAIRKQAYALDSAKGINVNYKFINPSLVKNQMSKKMFSLLEELYKRVSQQLPFKYSILEIGLHIDQINGLTDNYFETKKLVWFIMSVLQQIEKGKSVDKSISYLHIKNKKDDEPKMIKYKGDKVVAKDKMGTKNLFYNNAVSASTVREKSVEFNKNMSKTPPKKISFNKNNTFVKNSTSRSPLKSNTYQQSQNKKIGSELKTAAKKTSSPYNASTAKKISKY